MTGMHTNWWGFMGERSTSASAGSRKSEVVRGIPGSQSGPARRAYAMTEEFVAVYRMHPLIPDDYTFRSLADDQRSSEHTFPDLGELHVATC